MKIYLATDHAGFALKEAIKVYLQEHSYDVEDCGAFVFSPADDYPDFIKKAAKAISEDPQARGIIFGGTGQAEAMVANKFANVRAALFYSPCIPVEAADAQGRMSTDPFEIIRLSREHNDANIISLGARFLKQTDAVHAVQLWLNTPFSNETRHQRRIEKIAEIEKNF